MVFGNETYGIDIISATNPYELNLHKGRSMKAPKLPRINLEITEHFGPKRLL